jgi:hypothetical protein
MRWGTAGVDRNNPAETKAPADFDRPQNQFLKDGKEKQNSTESTLVRKSRYEHSVRRVTHRGHIRSVIAPTHAAILARIILKCRLDSSAASIEKPQGASNEHFTAWRDLR